VLLPRRGYRTEARGFNQISTLGIVPAGECALNGRQSWLDNHPYLERSGFKFLARQVLRTLSAKQPRSLGCFDDVRVGNRREVDDLLRENLEEIEGFFPKGHCDRYIGRVAAQPD
jgi:hypothetical protein